MKATPPADSKEGKGEEPEEELDLTGIDEEEIDSYLMTKGEIQQKTTLWLRVRAPANYYRLISTFS